MTAFTRSRSQGKTRLFPWVLASPTHQGLIPGNTLARTIAYSIIHVSIHHSPANFHVRPSPPFAILATPVCSQHNPLHHSEHGVHGPTGTYNSFVCQSPWHDPRDWGYIKTNSFR
nr:hypothetical protein L203_01910 [Cryptococcus depauperatus CBS 7841]